MIIDRYIRTEIEKDLAKAMVFIGGPRQVGKTSLSKQLMASAKNPLYFNYDNSEHRKAIRERRWTSDNDLLIFDELHKMPKWKSWIKGIYDVEGDQHKIIVTGSARLDVYKRGGDSLLGRYHYWRLHPFTIDEIVRHDLTPQDTIDRLLNIGGFPQPFLSMDNREANRWRRERIERVLTEDLRGLEMVRDIASLQVLVDLLRERVGLILAASNLARDLEVSSKTVSRWLELLEKMYLCFVIYPYAAKNLSRSLTKPPKVYFYDNGDVTGDLGSKFENLVATTLLKRLHWTEDYAGKRAQLFYLRDKDQRECDFLTVIDRKPDLCIEVKVDDNQVSKNLRYYAERIRARRAVQIVLNLKTPYESDGVLVTDPYSFFTKQEPFA
ncbi:MAG: ATP-binding protein [Proteobacteria bacterium]|nr:ATP-binding protein [Pseudomonadota bacterium]